MMMMMMMMEDDDDDDADDNDEDESQSLGDNNTYSFITWRMGSPAGRRLALPAWLQSVPIKQAIRLCRRQPNPHR